MATSRMSFARQALALQIVLITLVVGVGLALFSWLLQRELTAQYGERARAIAHAVAADPTIVEAAASRDPVSGRHDPNGVVAARAEQVRQRTGVLFVVVTDRVGIRLSHPNKSEIGQMVSTDPYPALAGQEVVTVQRGTLGASARAKVPLRDATGQIIGIVSVGFDVEQIQAHWLATIAIAGLFAIGALAAGVFGSALLTRRLRRLTLGLEPHELAELVQEREAVLHGIGEGVLAVDTAERVTICNGEAARLLGVEPVVGTALSDLDVAAALRSALTDDADAASVVTVANDRVLIANRRQVRRAGRYLGRVITLRDRTDVEALSSELDTVRVLTDGLRAQRHEFSNRLHVIAGLLQTGHHSEAVEYLHTLSLPAVAAIDTATDSVRDPYLRAFLAAKTAVAAERQVRLDIGEESWLPSRLTMPIEVTTVVGNLVDNAIEGARLGTARPAWIDIVLAADGDTLHVSVADSGDGVPDEIRETIFDQGVSTRAGDSRGLGLALARHAAANLDGEVWLASGGGEVPGQGAVFAARLPGVLAAVVAHGVSS